ncbi:WhiB family transcriptional regulator [Mycobacterium stomatepiae]|nr:WhiB family transcriptional regulator [Mycobacterium stomatepiae]
MANFFPAEHWSRNLSCQEEAAKKVRRDDPVVLACLQHVMNAPEAHGIWSGLTAHERTLLGSSHRRGQVD